MTVAEAQAALSQGNALRAAGRPGEAARAYRKAIELAPERGVAHYNLGIALREAGDWRGAALAFREAARRDPADYDAVQNVLDTVAGAVRADAPGLFAQPRKAGLAGTDPVSIVVCSVDDDRLDALRANLTAALAGITHEFVPVRDARSLAEGYSRGLGAARFDTVVLSHDDIEFISPRPFEAVAHALRDHDLVGLCGSLRVNGPAVTWAGHPHLRGWVAYPAQDGAWDATVFSLDAGILAGAQALDGLFMAGKRAALTRVGFDERTFDGFHFYDLDFSYRAHLAGLRVAITTDATVIHASAGRFDDEWQRYAGRFAAKFPSLAAPMGAHHAYGARLESREQVARFYDELRGLGATS